MPDPEPYVYVPVTWVDEVTEVDAENMNRLEQAVAAVYNGPEWTDLAPYLNSPWVSDVAPYVAQFRQEGPRVRFRGRVKGGSGLVDQVIAALPASFAPSVEAELAPARSEGGTAYLRADTDGTLVVDEQLPPGAIVLDQYHDAVVADAPLGYFRLHEASGGTYPDETGTMTILYHTSGVTYGEPGGAASADTSVRFLASRAALSTPNTGNDFAVTFLFRRAGTPRLETLYHKGTTNSPEIGFLTEAGRLQLRRNGGAVIAQSSTIVDDTQWHHAFVGKQGANAYIFIDGINVTQLVTDYAFPAAAAVARIGSNSGGGNAFDGWMDEVAIHAPMLPIGRAPIYSAAMRDPGPAGWVSLVGLDWPIVV